MSPGRIVFLVRNPLAGLPIPIALCLALGGRDQDFSLWLSGLIVALLGLSLRAWAGCLNGYGRDSVRRLVTSGPYAAMRNPLYLGSALLISGACLALGSHVAAFLAFVWSISIYHIVVLREESRLTRKYDIEYANYFTRVPRWMPRRVPPFGPFVPMRDFANSMIGEAGALALFLPSLAIQF